MHPHFTVWLWVRKGVCLYLCVRGCVGLLFIVLDVGCDTFLSLFYEEKFEEFVIFTVWEDLVYYFLRVFMRVGVLFSVNRGGREITGGKYVLWPLRMCIMFSYLFFFSNFLWSVHNGFCVSSWKAQGYEHFLGTFYWESTDNKCRLIENALRTVMKSLRFAESFKTMMCTSGF